MTTDTTAPPAVAAGQPPASTRPGAGAAASVLEELMRLEDRAMERWRQGDPMGWTEIVGPKVTYVDPGLVQPVVGYEQYARYMEALKGKISYGASEYTNAKAAVYGDVAVLTFNYRGSTRNADGTVTKYAPWDTTEVYARFDGQWKIIHTHWSYRDHTAPARVDVPVPVAQAPEEHPDVLGALMRLEATDAERLCQGDAADFLEPDAQVHGDTAVLFYRLLSARRRPDGGAASRRAWNCTRVYARLDGLWRVVHSHTSFICGQLPTGVASEAG
jgi:ketosteroid isomerase-like protein